MSQLILNPSVNEALELARAYRGSDAMQAMLSLIDAMVEEHKSRLLDVSPERLLKTQGAAAQLLALRAGLLGTGAFHDPTI